MDALLDSGSVNDVVRLTFKAFHDVLRQQGETIKGRLGICMHGG